MLSLFAHQQWGEHPAGQTQRSLCFLNLCWPHRQYSLPHITSRQITCQTDRPYIYQIKRSTNNVFKYIGPDSVVGIATGYGLDGPGIESQWGTRFSAPVQTGPGAHPVSCTMGTEYFAGVKSGRGVTLTPHPLLVPLFMKEYSYTSTPPMGRTASTDPQCLYKGALF